MGVTVDKKKVSTFIEINFSYFYLTPVWQIRVKRWMTQAAQSCCWACWRHQEGCQRQSGGPTWRGIERLPPWIVIRIMGNSRFCLLTWHSDVYYKIFCLNILACKFYLGFLVIWIASSMSTDSGIRMRRLIFIKSQWHFFGSLMMPAREAMESVLKSDGKGPAIRSPSKKVESAGHDLIL